MSIRHRLTKRLSVKPYMLTEHDPYFRGKTRKVLTKLKHERTIERVNKFKGKVKKIIGKVYHGRKRKENCSKRKKHS